MRLLLVLSFLSTFALPSLAQTGLLDRPRAQFFSHEGNLAFLAAGTLASHKPGESADRVLTAVALAQGLKLITRERRPDGSTRDSFPSGHATAAFAVAQLASQNTKGTTGKALWFVGASLIGDSRVSLRRHYVHDVLAGALLGIAVVRTPGLRISLLVPRRVQ